MKEHEKGCFCVTSVHRDDLEAVGFNTSRITDAEMEILASKMANAYVENGFWIDLKIIGDEYFNFPKRRKK